MFIGVSNTIVDADEIKMIETVYEKEYILPCVISTNEKFEAVYSDGETKFFTYDDPNMVFGSYKGRKIVETGNVRGKKVLITLKDTTTKLCFYDEAADSFLKQFRKAKGMSK